jgi:hypothetical protein
MNRYPETIDCLPILSSRVTTFVTTPCHGSKLTARYEEYIVTGAPGVGKTAVIRQLELAGFGVVEEEATEIMALWQAKGLAEP